LAVYEQTLLRAPNTTGRLVWLSAGRDQPFTTQLFESRGLMLALAITDFASPQLADTRIAGPTASKA
jgi:hypothetical protein